MTMIAFAIFFGLVSRASAAVMTAATISQTGSTVIGLKPTTLVIGATTTTDIPASGTITITPAIKIFEAGTATITVAGAGVTGACDGEGVATAITIPVLTITIPSTCSISGVWTATISTAALIANNPGGAVGMGVSSSTDTDALAMTEYTPQGLVSVTEVPTCLNSGDSSTLVVSATTAAVATAALATDDTFVMTSSIKIFEAGKTFASTEISMTGGATCAITAATSSDAIPILTVTLADAASTCAIAVSTAVVITIPTGFTNPAAAAAYTLSIAGKGATVAAAARTPTTAITEVVTIVDNQENGIKPSLIRYKFKNSGALAAAGTITITTDDASSETNIVFANAITDTTVTVKAGATTPAAVLCSVSALTTTTSMVVTLADSSSTCAIADGHAVEIDVTKAETIAVNPANKPLAAKITSSASATTSCVLANSYLSSGTKATLKSMTDDGTSFVGGATTSASGALAAAGTINFYASGGLFVAQTTATAVTLTGGTNCEATAVSATDAGGAMPDYTSLTVTLSDKATASCSIAASTAFTVTATGASFIAARPDADAIKLAVMSTSADVVALEGATMLSITHKAKVSATTTTTNTSNSSNSTSTGLMMDDAPRLQGQTFFVAIFAFFSFAAT